ncbi:MAG: hypothetical protein LBB25_02775, partial [Holosporaceae bacterium]|nr:hypothetical protein [Holosporaceae bacterium]
MIINNNFDFSKSSSIPNINVSESIQQGGKFQIRNGITNGVVEIKKIDKNIEITESFSMPNRNIQLSDAKTFETHKKAMAYFKENPNVDVKVIKTYEKEKDAEAWLKKNITPDSTINAIKETNNFKQCSPEQQKYIEQYARQMIEGGDKAEFASSVCEAMAILYRNDIEEKMPNEININEAYSSFSRIAPGQSRYRKMRAAVTKHLKKIMEENGGNYEIMNSYLHDQQFGVDRQKSVAMRYFMSQQRQDPNEERYLSADNAQTIEDAMKKYSEAYNQELKEASTNPEVYAKTVAMYKAFTAITLNKVNFQGRNENQTCTVYHGLTTESLNERYPDYKQTKAGDTVTIKYNILEPTPIRFIDCIPDPDGHENEIYEIHEMKVPFNKIFVAYFMSPEMCEEGTSSRNIRNPLVQEAFICDLADIPAEIKFNKVKWEELLLYQIAIDNENTINAIKETDNFKQCSPEQQKYIEQYAR